MNGMDQEMESARLSGDVRIRYVRRAGPDDCVLMRFCDPADGYAVLETGNTEQPEGELFELAILTARATLQPGSPRLSQASLEWLGAAEEGGLAPPMLVKQRGVEVLWRPQGAMLQCDADQVGTVLKAVIEFTYFEAELRRIEREIAGSWAELDQDQELAFEVGRAALRRKDEVGARMCSVLRRRIRFSRIEPFLWSPGRTLPVASRKLGEELREKADIEARVEAVDGQLETFEHVYEMGSQRMGEAAAAHQTQIVEWIIVLLLVGEVVLALLQVLLKTHG